MVSLYILIVIKKFYTTNGWLVPSMTYLCTNIDILKAPISIVTDIIASICQYIHRDQTAINTPVESRRFGRIVCI